MSTDTDRAARARDLSANLAAATATLADCDRKIAHLCWFIDHAPAGVDRKPAAAELTQLRHQERGNLLVAVRAALAAYEAPTEVELQWVPTVAEGTSAAVDAMFAEVPARQTASNNRLLKVVKATYNTPTFRRVRDILNGQGGVAAVDYLVSGYADHAKAEQLARWTKLLG